MGYPTLDSEWRDRANAAENELSAIREEIREYTRWLKDPVRGPIIFRSEVVERLLEILAP